MLSSIIIKNESVACAYFGFLFLSFVGLPNLVIWHSWSKNRASKRIAFSSDDINPNVNEKKIDNVIAFLYVYVITRAVVCIIKSFSFYRLVTDLLSLKREVELVNWFKNNFLRVHAEWKDKYVSLSKSATYYSQSPWSLYCELLILLSQLITTINCYHKLFWISFITVPKTIIPKCTIIKKTVQCTYNRE